MVHRALPRFLLLCLLAGGLGCVAGRPQTGTPASADRDRAVVVPGAPSGAASGAPSGAAPGATRRRLTLLHTNDIHASFVPGPATWRDDKAPVGGFEMLDAVVRRIRAERPEALLVDAGDVLTGNPISGIEQDGVRGWALFDLMNQVGYNAWTPGNHDFDGGTQSLFNALPKLRFPTVSANLASTGGGPVSRYVIPSTILSAGDVKVGIVGMMTPELPRLVAKSSLEGVVVTSQIDAVRAEVAKLEPVTDLVVLLSHSGETLDQQVAAAVPALDVIVGGHSHKRIHPPMKVGDTLIVQAGSNLQNLGRLDLEVEGHKVASFTSELVPLFVIPDAVASAPVREAVARAQGQIDAEFQKNVGELVSPWSRQYYAESNIGNWLTDQMRKKAGADVAFLNSGGIRKDIPAGPISRGDVMSILPFDGQLCTFKVTGAELKQILEADATAGVAQSHGIMQVSGVVYRWRRDGGAAQVLDVKVGGRPLEPARVYLVATSDFLLYSQPDKYFEKVEPKEPTRLSVSMVDLVVDALERERRTDARLEGRIVEEK